jgi:hypothetical protein
MRSLGKVAAGLVLCAMVVWLVVTLADLPYHQYSELPSPHNIVCALNQSFEGIFSA